MEMNVKLYEVGKALERVGVEWETIGFHAIGYEIKGRRDGFPDILAIAPRLREAGFELWGHRAAYAFNNTNTKVDYEITFSPIIKK